jgi:hypothetical protein
MSTKRRSSALRLLAIVGTVASCDVRIVNDPGADGEDACPIDPPAPGDPCEGADTCTYPRGPGCTAASSCLGERWRVSFEGDCDPPAPACPPAAPGEATPCFQIGAECSYDGGTECGSELVVTCVDPGAWHRGEIPPCGP